MSVTTFDLKNPNTGHLEKVVIPSQCPTCNWTLSLSVPDEQGRVRLRCHTCGYDHSYVPFPEDAASPGPTLTPSERQKVRSILRGAAAGRGDVLALADKFA